MDRNVKSKHNVITETCKTSYVTNMVKSPGMSALWLILFGVFLEGEEKGGKKEEKPVCVVFVFWFFTCIIEMHL